MIVKCSRCGGDAKEITVNGKIKYECTVCTAIGINKSQHGNTKS